LGQRPKVLTLEERMKYSTALEKISKLIAMSAGSLHDAASVIAREGCIALNTFRAGIWTTNDEVKMLKSLASYDVAAGRVSVQDDFILGDSRQQYVGLLKSERLIVINDVRIPNALSDIVDEYGPELSSLLDAPIRIEGKLVGVVCIEQNFCGDFPEGRVWTAEEQSFASSLADFMALTIAQNERLELMKRNKTLMSNLPGMVYQCINNPPDFTFTYVSDGCYDLMGYTAEEMNGNNTLSFFDLVHPDDVRTLMRLNEETLSVGLPLDTTFRIITKDGDIKWIWERSSVVEFTPDGEAYVLEGFYADITERRRLEAAESASRFKSDFLAKMSHEIRTPLNAIMGMAELALREEMSDSARVHNLTIKQAGSNLLAIINDILDFSKIESGQLELVPDKYQVASLLNDVINIIKMRALDSFLQFVVNVDPHVPDELFGDAVRIRQIMLNLLSNAVKYTEKGHVIFNVTGEKIDEGNFRLVVSVEDSGIGIRQENIGKLFDEFTQFDSEFNKDKEGTGLGLAITRSLIQAMDGGIEVASEYGVGSTFTVTLPQMIIGRNALARVEDADTKDVLVFEQHPNRLQALTRTLEDLKVKYLFVSCASEFYDGLASKKFAYAFISSALYSSIKNIYTEYDSDTKLILISEFGESIPDKDINVLTTPIYSIPVANILNDEYNMYSQSVHNMYVARFNAPDARVLVVDDIYTNLKVTEGLLQPYNIQIDLCSGGLEAIEAAAVNHYDLIFMDHMMPDMDGLEAVARIRALGDINFPDFPIQIDRHGIHSRMYYRNVPIIALTANAVTGAKEMFLANGFNDFLSKPIDIMKLDAFLEKWIPKEKQIKAVNNYNIREISGSFEIPGIDTGTGIIMTGGSIDNYLGALTAYYDDGKKRLGELNSYLEPDNLRTYTIYVHALKSASASIGANGLSEAAMNLEMAGLRGDIEYIKEHNPSFTSNLEALLKNIAAALDSHNNKKQQKPVDMGHIKTLLFNIREAMDRFDVETINETANILRDSVTDDETGVLINKVLQYKLTGDYEEAIELINSFVH